MGKWVLAVLVFLLIMCGNTHAQTIFKADLYVLSVLSDTTTCDKQTVYWGFSADTVGFLLDRERVFVTLKPQPYVPYDNVSGDVVLVRDELGQRCSIRYLTNDDGFIFWITTIGLRDPHFVISTVDICAK